MNCKILSLILAVCLLFATLVLFASCSEGGEVSLSGKKVDVDLTEYSLVYPDTKKEGAYSRTFQGAMSDLASAINTATGLNLRAFSESKTRSNAASPEILVGLTSRAESVEAHASIEGNGYTVQVINNKIVIVGTTPLLTLQAVSYFKENYLTGNGSSKTVTVHEEVMAEKMEMVTLADSAGIYYSLVYDDMLDTDGTSEYDAGSAPGSMTFNDYAFDATEAIGEKMLKQFSLKKKALTVMDDSAAIGEKELVVGITQRPVSQQALTELSPNEYGVFVKDGNVAVIAWNVVGLMLAAEAFQDYLYESLVTDEAGNVSIQMPKSLKITGKANEKWKLDFPKPEGLTLYNTVDVADDSLEYLYLGDNVNAAAFESYCALLENAGYRQTEENEIEDSLFATYVNEKVGISLYVAYNAFKHAAGSEYENADPALRIVSSPINATTVPATSLLSDSYTAAQKKNDSAITAVELPASSSGTGYIITLEDGRFVMIDSGNPLTGSEMPNLWNALTDLHQKNTGLAVSISNPVKIAAWILTHSHADHYGVFTHLLQSYGATGLLEIEYVLGSFPSNSQLYNTTGSDNSMNSKMEAYQRLCAKPFTFVRVHTGQRLYFANMEIETLFTHEDLNPHNIVTLNDSSSIMRLTLRVTGGEDVTFLSTGDAFRYSGKWCSAMYGETLQSDMVTVGHHGGPNVDKLFYTLVAPTTV